MRLPRSKALFPKLARSSAGTVAVEFALVFFPFIASVFCVAEASFDYYALSALDAATHKIARQIQTGSIQGSGTTTTQFGSTLCGLISAPLVCSNLFWNVKTTTDFYSLTTASAGANGITQYSLKQPSLVQANNTYCPGGSNDYVVVQLIYVIPVITGIWSTGSIELNGKTVRVISTSSVFRNEAFGTIGQSSC